MRKLVPIALLCSACTFPNPKFDGRDTNADSTGDESTTQPNPDTGTEAEDEAETEGESEGEGETGTDTAPDDPDLPLDPTCEMQPSDGLSIQIGGPQNFGGVCANGINTTVLVKESGGGTALLEVCSDGCSECGDNILTTSMFPMIVSEHLPTGTCLKLEADHLLATGRSTCHWGAATLFDWNAALPRVIATAHSLAPTATGAQLLGEKIPEPLEGFACNCDAVGQSNDCCYQALSPAFFYYPFADGDVYAGHFIALPFFNQLGLDHYFELYQAQHITTCENQDLQLSWAVVAKF